MTVTANVTRNQYIATPSQTIFNYTFEVSDQAYLLVYLTPSGQEPNDVLDLLTVVADYTVTGVGVNAGGTIVLNTPASIGDVITIQGNTAIQRSTSFTPGGVIQAQNLNNEFDNETLITQTVSGVLQTLTPKYQKTAVVEAADLDLPLLGTNQAWVKDSNGIIQPTTISTSEGVYLPLAGGTMLGPIHLDGPATQSDEPVTLAQAQEILTNQIGACFVATTANLSGYSYSNGASGVGATLTAGSNGAFSANGQSPGQDARVLVPYQSTAAQNGIYILTTVGDGSHPAVLTRAGDFDTTDEMVTGVVIAVTNGSVDAPSQWMFTSPYPVTIGTSSITFSLVDTGGFLVRANNLSDVASASTSRTNLGAQTVNANLTSISALGTAANKIPYTTDITTWAETAISAFGRSLIAAANGNAAGALIGTLNGVSMQLFTTTGTYTPTTGMQYCLVFAIGGGGGSGGVYSTAGNVAVGEAGGGGGIAIDVFDATDIGASKAVTVGAAGAAGASGSNNGGAGGTTTFGTLLTANGGAGGAGRTSTPTVGGITGASGGTASGGLINISGSAGQGGIANTNPGAFGLAGAGGSPALFGNGGTPGVYPNFATGIAPTGYGGGGGGVAANSPSAGVAGTAGAVIILEFT